MFFASPLIIYFSSLSVLSWQIKAGQRFASLSL